MSGELYKMVIRVTVFSLFVMAFILIFSIGSEDTAGETITVDDSGGADYENIQDAIDAAEDGDTVRVFDGYYEENVVVNKSIDFVGNGSETTTIDAGGNDDVVKVTEDWVNISGFKITGSAKYGSGIKIEIC